MDRTSNKKIVMYLLLWFVSAVILTCSFIVFAACNEAANRRRITEFIQEHPEAEADIIEKFQTPSRITGMNGDTEESIHIIEEKYGYVFYKSVLAAPVFYLWGFLFICSLIWLLLVIYREKKREKQSAVLQEALLEMLAEELKRFQKGEYQLSSESLSLIEESKLSDKWMHVIESLKELGYYFNDLKAQLQEEENSTKALITNISHQLKVPLASLHMNHELAMAEGLTTKERREFEEQEMHEIQRMEMLLEELVKVSKLEKHMITLHLKRQGIRQTIADAVSQVYGKAKKKQIDIQAEIRQDFSVLHDRKWTTEALSNVMDNAVKYSEEQSKVCIHVQKLTSCLLIEIEDEGIGIPSGELHHIFKRFYRGKDAVKKVTDGVGVGLYLSRTILEQQGGTIMAKRKPDKGTVFQITLPI